MAKSYVPQLAKRLQMMSVYISKHRTKMTQYTLTSAQLADLTTLQTIAADFSTIPWQEQP